MKHHLITALLLTIIAIPTPAQNYDCDYIDPICNKARELMQQGQYEQALSGLEEATKDSGIKNCSNAYKIRNLISEIKKKHPSASLSQTTTYTVNGVSFKMITVEGGSFDMGSNDGCYWEKPVHRVTLSSYAIGETEVTQALWQAVMGNHSSYFTGESNLPVKKVSWDDCQTFAARGGNNRRDTKFSGDNTLSNVGWYYENSGDSRFDDSSLDYDKLKANHCRTHPVKQKAHNELGLYDMSGNVWECCQDYYDSSYYSKSPTSNPRNDTEASIRVIRGSGWYDLATGCRVSKRYWNTPGSRGDFLGLRLAL